MWYRRRGIETWTEHEVVLFWAKVPPDARAVVETLVPEHVAFSLSISPALVLTTWRCILAGFLLSPLVGAHA